MLRSFQTILGLCNTETSFLKWDFLLLFSYSFYFLISKSEPFGMLSLGSSAGRGFIVTLGALPFGEAACKSLGTLDQTSLENWDG